MPTFCGVILSQPTAELAAHVEHYVSLKDIVEFRPTQHWERIAQAMPFPNQIDRPVKLGRLWWPTGASRFAIGHFLATESQLSAIRAAGPFPGMLVISDGITSILAPMSMLPPRPLTQVPGDAAHYLKWLLPVGDFGKLGEPVYIITMVDDRYFWWDRPYVPISITEQRFAGDTNGTTWAQLFAVLGTALGITINVDVIDAPYIYPAASLSEYNDRLPLLLDLCAASIGQRVIRTFDGKVYTQRARTALAQVQKNLAANLTNRVAGGRFALDNA